MEVAGEMVRTSAVRLFHLTFYKCGSQWVRDILADPRIVEYSGHTLVAGGVDLQSERWPVVRAGEFASPLYSTGTGEWREVSGPDDRAFVVLRDPRDIVVSLVFSVSLSHTPTAITLLLRDPIADAAPAHRLQIGMFLLAQWVEYLRSWKFANEFSTVYLTRYETLIEDLAGEMSRLFAFLGWEIPEDVIRTVAEENQFESRSGRKRGEENEFSHRRKGIAGDWRNHFDRRRAELFESAFPSLLVELGYETTNDWWREVPERIEERVENHAVARSRLLAVLEEHEKELAGIRIAAEERLRDVLILHDLLKEKESEKAALEEELERMSQVAEGRSHDVETLHGLLADAERRREEQLAIAQEEITTAWQAAEERLSEVEALRREQERQGAQLAEAERTAAARLADILKREGERRELEASFSWRFGFRPVRALGSMFRR